MDWFHLYYLLLFALVSFIIFFCYIFYVLLAFLNSSALKNVVIFLDHFDSGFILWVCNGYSQRLQELSLNPSWAKSHFSFSYSIKMSSGFFNIPLLLPMLYGQINPATLPLWMLIESHHTHCENTNLTYPYKYHSYKLDDCFCTRVLTRVSALHCCCN